MENTNPIPSKNILAAAMSTANLMNPDSPKYTIKEEIDATKIFHTVPPPSLQNKSEMIKAMSMETTDPLPPPHILIGQEIRDGDSMTQALSNHPHVSPNVNKPFTSEDVGKEVARNDVAAPHLIPVTSANDAFQVVTLNGDVKPHISCNSISSVTDGKNLINVDVDAQSSNSVVKTEGNAVENIRPKPSEDTTYPITCGPNRAELVWKRFICPGINAKCVKCGENWFTPKEFVNYAGKSTLKDWKRAIRINGIMLRRLIENGELNYYEHETNCSNQCRSNKNNTSFDSGGERSYGSFDADSRDANGKEHPMDNTTISLTRASSEDPHYFTNKKANLSALYHKPHENAIGQQPSRNSLERSSSEDSGLAASPLIDSMLMRDAPVTLEKLQDLERFWNGVARLDFFDEIVCDVMAQIRSLHGRAKVAGCVNVDDVIMLTNLVNTMEMFPNIVHRVSLHKHKVEKETVESNHTIQELEKKLAEQKKYDQDLKRKSRHLDNVILLTPNEKRPKRNIIRIGRQKAVESRIPPGPSSQSIPGPDIRENVMLAAAASRAGIGQRDMWPGPAMQVDSLARVAATSQIAAQMNAANTAQAAITAGLPPFTIFPPIRTTPDVLVSSSLHQAFVSSPQGSRESTQSPKK